MNAGRRNSDLPERSEKQEAAIEQQTVQSSLTATVERPLYSDLAEWLDRDLARLEDLYKGWATAGYGQWRRRFKAAQ